jgi:hypothetical protein
LAVFGDHSNLKHDIAASAHSKESRRPLGAAFGQAQLRAGQQEVVAAHDEGLESRQCYRASKSCARELQGGIEVVVGNAISSSTAVGYSPSGPSDSKRRKEKYQM